MSHEQRLIVQTSLDAAGLRRWLRAATDVLEQHRAELDALNVFPVADNDTGANVVATLRGALAEPDAGLGAARAARGNSGLILAELLRGILDAAAGQLTGESLLAGLRAGAERAHRAVVLPVQGTALTVAAEAADASQAGPLIEVAQGALERANRALLATREQLPQLRRAGVVDAGGRAVCLLLAALVGAISGQQPSPVQLPVPPAPVEPRRVDVRYEVQYEVQVATIDELRTRLSQLGDSVVIAPLDRDCWSVHVHTDDAGAAIEAGLAVGRPRRIRIETLAGPIGCRQLIAIGLDSAVHPLLLAAGVQVLDPAEVQGVASTAVLLVTDATEAAQAAAARIRAIGGEAAVLPVRSPLQALAAVAVHDPDAEFSDAVVAMAEAAAAIRCAEVRISEGPGQTSVGPCRAGDVLGLADGEVLLIGADASAVAAVLLDRLLATSGELVTLLGGSTVKDVRRHLAVAHPTVEIVEIQAPDCGATALLIGVE